MQLKSRYRKLTRLAHSSSGMIREFGFIFFLNTAYFELKKNKFSVFSPIREFKKPPKIASQSSYNQWLKIHEITDKMEQEMKDKSQRFSKLKMAVVISLYDSNKKLFSETLNSTLSQIYENWTIYFDCQESITKEIRELAKKTDLEDKRINFMENNFQNFDLENFDYCIFVNGGSVLTKDALYRIASHLNEEPEADIIYSDEDFIDSGKRTTPFFKPDWSPETFLSMDYLSSFYAVRAELLKETSFRDNYGDAKHYDLLLRLGEKTNKISHISTVLVSIREPRCKETDESIQSAIRCLTEALKRRNIKGEVVRGKNNAKDWPIFRIKYEVEKDQKVSIIIPTKDNVSLLKRCLLALKKTTYKNYEIVIIDNNSTKQETLSYLKSLPYTIVRYPNQFNFSKMNNLAVTKTSGEYLLFLNDDTAPLEPNWLSEMVGACNQDGVGAVGAKLVHLDNTIQHAGIVLLKTGAGFHPWQNVPSNEPVNFGFLNLSRNCTAVTGACLLIKKTVFEEIGGYDDEFDLYYGDTDLCMKVVDMGYRVVYNPYAKLLHQGSSTIKEHSSAFFAVENHYHFVKKWPHIKKGDPFYNPNLEWNYEINLNPIETVTTESTY